MNATLAVVFALVGCSAVAAAESPADFSNLESPLRQGTLPNGLHYAVLPHASAKGDIALRLIVHAGSLDERDDERGFAHFIEHMAFEGSRHFPPGTVRYFFQGLGVEFGADINASTGFTHTIYMLDLPEGRADKLDEALILLHDDADGVLFPDEQVKTESGVVVGELLARDNNRSRLALQVLEAVYANELLPERIPGGVREQLEHATSAKLRAFYQRNYLPERMTVVVVGPVDPVATIEKISSEFGPIARPGAVAPAAPVTPPKIDGVKPEVVVVPTRKGGVTVQITAIGVRPPDDLAGHRTEVVQRIATAILKQRLVARRERQDVTAFGPPDASYEAMPFAPIVHHGITISAASSSWSDGIALAESELRRACTEGFTQAEVDEAVANQLTALRNRVAEVAGQPASRVASDLARLVSLDRTWKTAASDLAEVSKFLEGLEATEVTSALQEIFPSDALHLTMIVGPGDAMKPERVLAAYTSSAGRALKKAPAQNEELRFAYDEFGPPGEIAKREHVDDLDLTLVSFANGVRLNVRPSTLEPERFRLRIVFPQNYSDVPANRGGIIDFAGELLLNSNLRKHKASEMSRLVKMRGISPQFVVTNGTPVLTMRGPSAELTFALHLLAALLSDLDFDQDHYRVALSFYGSKQRAFQISSTPYALNEALYQHLGKDSRVTWNAPEIVARYPADETEGWLREHILRGPLEVGIVGDFSADEAVAAAAGSIGTLKRRGAGPKRGDKLAVTAKSIRVEGAADIPASAAVSCVLWPVTTPDDPRHNAALELATDVLGNHLLLALREMLGATYSPYARVHRDMVQRDFAFAAMVSTFDPVRARQLTEGSIKLAGLIAERGVSAAEFARVREPARARHAADIRDNGWWLDAVVSVAQSRPEVLDEARRHEKLIDEITLEDVNEAAKVFQPANVTVVILRPKPPKPPKS